jgi:hypothetical protein
MVEKFSAKKKLWVSKVDEIGFLLRNPVHVHVHTYVGLQYTIPVN